MEQFYAIVIGLLVGYTFSVFIKLNKALDKYLKDKEF